MWCRELLNQDLLQITKPLQCCGTWVKTPDSVSEYYTDGNQSRKAHVSIITCYSSSPQLHAFFLLPGCFFPVGSLCCSPSLPCEPRKKLKTYNRTMTAKRPANPATSQTPETFKPQAAPSNPSIKARTIGTRGLFTPLLGTSVAFLGGLPPSFSLSGISPVSSGKKCLRRRGIICGYTFNFRKSLSWGPTPSKDNLSYKLTKLWPLIP
jgi:hypothetical protein